MWVESLKLDNIKCFENQTINLSKNGSPVKWVTFISENGGGKSTALQALALLLAGPESVHELLSRPQSWLKDETSTGLISTRIHQDSNDSGKYGDIKIRKEFGYSFHVTGAKPLTIRQKTKATRARPLRHAPCKTLNLPRMFTHSPQFNLLVLLLTLFANRLIALCRVRRAGSLFLQNS